MDEKFLASWREHPLLLPFETYPKEYFGSKTLSHSAWLGFVESVETEKEIPLHFSAHDECNNILEVGGGTGLLLTSIADRYVKCTLIEQSAKNASRIHVGRGKIKIIMGLGEALPFKDSFHDAVLATLVLHYTGSSDRCVKEMVRVCTKKPGSRVILVPASSWNEVIKLLNLCALLAGNPPEYHIAHFT